MNTKNTDKQPEALRLAAWLNEGAWHQVTLGDVEAAGRELRRLHSANQTMLKALRDIHAMPGISQGAAIIASAAVFQATGELL